MSLNLVTFSVEWEEKASELISETKNGEKETSNLEVRETLCQDISQFSMPSEDIHNGKNSSGSEEEIYLFARYCFLH